MKKTVKTSIAILACLLLLISSTGYSLAKETKKDEEQQSMTVTFYRYGIDGSITPINTEIGVGKGQNVEEKLANKCSELLQNDGELQNILENLTLNFTVAAGFLFVKSSGKGFHFESKTRTKLLKRPKILSKLLSKIKFFKIKLPKLKLFDKKPYLFCRYPKDPEANTTITPIVRSIVNESYIKNVQGNHSVFVYDFVGYTTWCGRFSFSPLDVLPRAFAGYGRVIICNNLS